MRKKLSPALVLSWLLALSMVVYCAMLYVHTNTLVRIHGDSIREDIFRIHDTCKELSKMLEEKDEAIATESLWISGRLSSMHDGINFNEDYGRLILDLASDLAAYGSLEDKDSAAAALLLEDIELKTNALYKTTQYIVEKLYDKDISKMNTKYFDARVPSENINRQISSVVKNLLAGQTGELDEAGK